MFEFKVGPDARPAKFSSDDQSVRHLKKAGRLPQQAERNKLPESSDSEITTLLQAWQEGDQDARDSVFQMVYPDLRRIAKRQMGLDQSPTFQATEIVHESFLRLSRSSSWTWRSRAQFFALAAQLVRQVLVDHIRHKGSLKRGCAFLRADIELDHLASPAGSVDLLALDEAIGQLGDFDAMAARIVEMRYFGGLTIPEVAEVLTTSPSTVSRRWEVARAWLHRELSK